MYVSRIKTLILFCSLFLSTLAFGNTATSYFLTIDKFDQESKTLEGHVCKYLANVKKDEGHCLPLNRGTYRLTLFDDQGTELKRSVDIVHRGKKWSYSVDLNGISSSSIEIVLQDRKFNHKKHISKRVRKKYFLKFTI